MFETLGRNLNENLHPAAWPYKWLSRGLWLMQAGGVGLGIVDEVAGGEAGLPAIVVMAGIALVHWCTDLKAGGFFEMKDEVKQQVD